MGVQKMSDPNPCDVFCSYTRQDRACQRANRNPIRAEWQHYLPGEPYRPTCPDLPVPED